MKKISKILVLALTLVLVFSMAGPFTGAAFADDVEWSKMSFPKDGEDGNYFRSEDIVAVGPIAVAIDDTLYLYIDNGNDRLLKSTNGGRSWSRLTRYEGGRIVDFATSPTDANVLYAVDEDGIISRTTNGGSAFTQIDASGEIAGTPTGIDFGVIAGATYVFLSESDGAQGGGVWRYDDTYTGGWTQILDSVDALDIRTSPDFGTDRQLVAVFTNGTDTFVTYKYGNADWDTDVDDVTLDDAGSFVAETARIAFPDNYDSDDGSGELEFFVATNDGGATAFNGVHRIVVSTGFLVDAGDFASIAVKGNVGSASILAGKTAGGATSAVRRSTDGTGDSWSSAKRAPIGTDAVYVVMADDFLDSNKAWAAVDGTNGGVSLQVADRVWNQISAIAVEIDEFIDFALADNGNIRFIVSDDLADYSLWRYDGTNWERVEVNNPIDFVELSHNFASDGAVFYGSDETIFKATSRGNTAFTALLSDVPETPFAFLALDTSTLLAGSDNEVYRSTNGGTTWSRRISGLSAAVNIMNFAVSPANANDNTILAGDNAGSIFRSTNNGSTWERITKGAFSGDAGGTVYVAFDPNYATSGRFFAAGDDGADLVVDYYDPTDGWKDSYPGDGDVTKQGGGAGDDTEGATGLVIGPDGTLYVSDSSAAGVLRSLNPTATTPVYEQADEDSDNELGLLRLTQSNSLNMLWGAFETDVYNFTDTLAVKVNGLKTSATRESSATFTWDALADADEYQVQVNTSDDFKGISYNPANAVEANHVIVTDLEPGTDYYVRVRVKKSEPLLSRYSSTVRITTALGAADWTPFQNPQSVAPAPGSSDVGRTPVFQWNPAFGATGYEVQLADNSAFTSPLASATTSQATYAPNVELKYSTTYFWRVRAVKGDTKTEWATGIFTTRAEPTVAPTPTTPPPQPPQPTPTFTVTVPPQPPAPAPSTPAYIWAIIAIGAILVIVVLILIVRTRRPA